MEYRLSPAWMGKLEHTASMTVGLCYSWGGGVYLEASSVFILVGAHLYKVSDNLCNEDNASFSKKFTAMSRKFDISIMCSAIPLKSRPGLVFATASSEFPSRSRATALSGLFRLWIKGLIHRTPNDLVRHIKLSVTNTLDPPPKPYLIISFSTF